MVFIFVPVISIISIILGKQLLGKWFNHLTIYCIIWSVLILLYEWKLIKYVEITPVAWIYVSSAFISFLLGILTITSARNFSDKKPIFSIKKKIDLTIICDNGKALKYSLFVFSVITIILAIQHWMLLLSTFGSIPAVILNGSNIYKMSLKGQIKGALPYYFTSIGYLAVFLSGIYTAYRGKFSLLTFLPFIGIILRELANVGRVGMLFAILEFVITYFLFRNFLNTDSLQRFKLSRKNAFFATLILLTLFIVSSSLVRLVRTPAESFVGASRQISELKNNVILTPTLYFYLSSDLGVLNQYFKADEGDRTGFGENSFLQAYNILSQFGIVKRPKHLQKGYFIPMWSNTGTYIREIHADFGFPGVFLFPYFLGLFLTWLWFKFYQDQDLLALVFMVYFYLVVAFSFLVMITRLPYWIVSLFLIIFYLPILGKIAVFFRNKSSFIKIDK